MSDKKSTGSGIIGSASEHAGASVGKIAAIGAKIGRLGARGVASVGDLLVRPVETPVLVADQENHLMPEAPACKPAGRQPAGRENGPTPPAVLESDLAAFRRELEEARGAAEKAQAQLASQLRALQAEKQSLIAELEGARDETKDRLAREGALRARVAAVESELAAARGQLEQSQSEAAEARSQLVSQPGDLPASRKAHPLAVQGQRNRTTGAAAGRHQTTAKKAGGGKDLSKKREKALVSHSVNRKAKPPLPSAAGAVRTKAETVSSDRRREKAPQASAREKAAPAREAAAATRPAEKPDRRIEQQEQEAWPPIAQPETPSLPGVSMEEVRAAVFPEVTDRIIFTRALADMVSRNVAARADAARVMAGIRHALSVKALAAQMAREPSEQVRQECVMALTELEMQEAIPELQRALTDRAVSVRLAAVKGIYRLAGPESAPVLKTVFADENEEVRRRAVTCIGWLGQEEHAVALLPLLADGSVLVRRAAVEAMANLRSRRVVSGLIECLDDPDESIRKVVLRALQTITGKKMVRSLPIDKKAHQRLVARWHDWWKGQYQDQADSA